MQNEITKTQEFLTAAHKELDTLKQDLAEEKFNRVSAEAELDATKSKKPDTSEADALRKELQDLKTEHLAFLETAKQTNEAATKEVLDTKTALEKLQALLAKEQAERKSDFDDMHSSLTQVCEEATKKASDAEAQLEITSSKFADIEARLKEAEAVIKVKEAELAEAKVSYNR